MCNPWCVHSLYSSTPTLRRNLNEHPIHTYINHIKYVINELNGVRLIT
jgi:hypothetical protein